MSNIFKFGVYQAYIEQDTAIQKLQYVLRNISMSGYLSGNPYIYYKSSSL